MNANAPSNNIFKSSLERFKAERLSHKRAEIHHLSYIHLLRNNEFVILFGISNAPLPDFIATTKSSKCKVIYDHSCFFLKTWQWGEHKRKGRNDLCRVSRLELLATLPDKDFSACEIVCDKALVCRVKHMSSVTSTCRQWHEHSNLRNQRSAKLNRIYGMAQLDVSYNTFGYLAKLFGDGGAPIMLTSASRWVLLHIIYPATMRVNSADRRQSHDWNLVVSSKELKLEFFKCEMPV